MHPVGHTLISCIGHDDLLSEIYREVIAYAHSPEALAPHGIVHHLARHRQGSTIRELKLMPCHYIEVTRTEVIIAILTGGKGKQTCCHGEVHHRE